MAADSSAGQQTAVPRVIFFARILDPHERTSMDTYTKSSNEAMRVSKISIVLNTLLSGGKLVAGILGGSGAMVSDAIHSASDVFSTIVVMIGIKSAEKAPDKEHPYGHERMECVAAIFLAGTLIATAIGIGASGVRAIEEGGKNLEAPGLIALIAAIISIIVKEIMFQYTKSTAKRVRSDALMADAWHHRSDAMSSIGSLCGILGARLGFPIMDSIASLVICLFIIKAAIDIFREAIGKMVDHSCDRETEEEIHKAISSVQGVKIIDYLQTREFGSKAYVDVEIGVEAEMSLISAHFIAEEVHRTIEQKFPEVKHCMVHVNPR